MLCLDIPPEEWKIHSSHSDSMNTLGLVVISIVTGMALSILGNKTTAITTFITQINELVMKCTAWVIALSPIGIFFLVVAQMVKMSSLIEMFGKLGMYSTTVILGLFIHGFITLPLFYFLHTRKNPYTYLAGTAKALATAFGTASR